MSLALGIGVNTTIFSAVDAVLLKPLPFSLLGLRGHRRVGAAPLKPLSVEKQKAKPKTRMRLPAPAHGGTDGPGQDAEHPAKVRGGNGMLGPVGIGGANTTIFSAVDTFPLKPFPYGGGKNILAVAETPPAGEFLRATKPDLGRKP